ncbi:small acid-soluble spore protein Tlp [Bacillus sp. N9]
MDNHKPKPDDRSDNVEKLQEMVHNTIENIERAEESMQFSDSAEQHAQIQEKMKDVVQALKE